MSFGWLRFGTTQHIEACFDSMEEMIGSLPFALMTEPTMGVQVVRY